MPMLLCNPGLPCLHHDKVVNKSTFATGDPPAAATAAATDANAFALIAAVHEQAVELAHIGGQCWNYIGIDNVIKPKLSPL